MIIPVRCIHCGKLLADKWIFYQSLLKEENDRSLQMNGRIYFENGKLPETAEKKIFEKLHLTRWCCRKSLLTHVDLLGKF